MWPVFAKLWPNCANLWLDIRKFLKAVTMTMTMKSYANIWPYMMQTLAISSPHFDKLGCVWLNTDIN